MSNNFPDRILKVIGSNTLEPISIGMSAADVWRCGDLYLKRTPFGGVDDEQKPFFKSEQVKLGHISEADAVEWLQGKLPVPELIDRFETDTEGWLVTKALDGDSLLAYEGDEKTVLRVMCEGLEALASVDVTDCPLGGYGTRALPYARANAEMMTAFPDDREDWNNFPSPMALYDWLAANEPKIASPGLVHGDYCLPNIFAKNGHFSGVLDLGWCGVGDRWLDIALGVRSLGFNGFHDNVTAKLCEMLHVEQRDDLIRYYILLDELF